MGKQEICKIDYKCMGKRFVLHVDENTKQMIMGEEHQCIVQSVNDNEG